MFSLFDSLPDEILSKYSELRSILPDSILLDGRFTHKIVNIAVHNFHDIIIRRIIEMNICKLDPLLKLICEYTGMDDHGFNDFREINQIKMINLVIDLGATNFNDALTRAVFYGAHKVVEILFDKGANNYLEVLRINSLTEREFSKLADATFPRGRMPTITEEKLHSNYMVRVHNCHIVKEIILKYIDETYV